GVARVRGVARRDGEISERRPAVHPLTVERRRADEAAGGSAEYDVRAPDELAGGVPGQAVENVVRPVLATGADPRVPTDIDDVRRGAEVEVAGGALASTERQIGRASCR